MLLAVGSACTAPAPEGPDIRIDDPWGRPTPQMFDVAAFYMVLQNKGTETDRLMGGASEPCGVVELHETYLTDDGASGMRPVPGGFIEVPPGGEVELKPGGLHVMCIDKQAGFDPGAKVPLTLYFEKSGDKTVDVQIRETE
jgi:hypothetical protein